MNAMQRPSFPLTLTTLAKAACVAAMLASLQGCPLIVVGAAGGGALVATDRRTVGSQTEDREIQVKSQLQLGQALPDSAHVNVTVVNNTVLLTGEVPSDAIRAHAEQVVRAIPNVRNVVNQLGVMPAASFGTRSNDTYLEGRVKTALIAEKTISANDFKVIAERGSIYLMGLVTETEGAQGALTASTVPGVKEVVKVFTYLTPAQANNLSLDTRGAASAPAVSDPGVAPGPGATVTPIQPADVSAQPLGAQTGAPITEESSGSKTTELK
jgi:osmotically-inducible protein OsmY